MFMLHIATVQTNKDKDHCSVQAEDLNTVCDSCPLLRPALLRLALLRSQEWRLCR